MWKHMAPTNKMADRRQSFDKDTPPFSRVFVIHGKGFSENDFKTEFEKFGEIQDVWMVKNKYTGEEKGITYIKFSKASEAALAIEELNQRTIGDHPKPIKVVLANNRDEGSGRDPKEELKMLRIFVIIPKSYTEDDLRSDFKEYGDIEHVSVIKDRKTGEAKGFGYVKYHRAFHAALALEKCPSHFKPKFAEPKGAVPAVSTKRPRYDDHYSRDLDRGDYRPSRMSSSRGRYDDFDGYSSGNYGAYGSSSFVDSREMRHSMEDHATDDMRAIGSILSRFGRPNGPVDVEAELSSSNVSTLQLKRLFSLVPGLDSFDYTRNSEALRYTFVQFPEQTIKRLLQKSRIAVMRYTTPQLAAYACEQFNDFEYPIGYPIRTRLLMSGGSGDFCRTPRGGSGSLNMEAVIDQIQNLRGVNDTGGLVQALKQVSSLLGQHGNGTSGPSGPSGPSSAADLIDNRLNSDGTCSVRYCDIPLPPYKPTADPNATCEERLFLVCQPRAIRVELLQDALCRFGNLIDVYLQPGKNFGYARFADKSSAHRCVDVLHGQEIHGQRLKVIISDPPRAAGSSSSSSRDETTSARREAKERW